MPSLDEEEKLLLEVWVPLAEERKPPMGARCRAMKQLHAAGTIFSIRVCGPIPEPGAMWYLVLDDYKNTIRGLCGAEQVENYILDWYPSATEIIQDSAARWCVYLRCQAIHASWAKSLVLRLDGAGTQEVKWYAELIRTSYKKETEIQSREQ